MPDQDETVAVENYSEKSLRMANGLFDALQQLIRKEKGIYGAELLDTVVLFFTHVVYFDVASERTEENMKHLLNEACGQYMNLSTQLIERDNSREIPQDRVIH